MKGFVFSLDAMMAVFIFVIMISTIFYFIKIPKSSYAAESDAALIASDIISLLDDQGILDSLDPTQIANNLTLYLPSNLNMSITLRIYEDDLDFDETRQVNTDLTEDYFAGKWLFIVGNVTAVQNYVIADYKVGFR